MTIHEDDASSTLSHERELMHAIIAALPRELSDEHRVQLSAFVPVYFDNLTGQDLSELSAEDLAGLALSLIHI